MADSADWSDGNLKVVCELFAEQVRVNNRSGSHLNKQEYLAVIEKFKRRTGISYTKMQFKNKWDKLKKEYTNWKQLAKETGAGWNPTKKTYEAPDWWWKKANKEFKRISKFKDRGLQNEEELSIMFEDLRNTGDDHWAPTSGAIPQNNGGQEDEENDADRGDPLVGRGEPLDGQEDDDSEGEDGTLASGKAKRRCVVDKDKGKKPKSSGGHWMQEQMSKIVELNEKTSTSCASIVLARMQDNSSCSIKEVMELVKSCGAVAGTTEHFIATQIFTKKPEREMFMTLDTPEERFTWLSMKYEWVKANQQDK